MTKRTTFFKYLIVSGFVLQAAAVQTTTPLREAASPPPVLNEVAVDTGLWFSELPDGRGGTNFEPILLYRGDGFRQRAVPGSFRGYGLPAP